MSEKADMSTQAETTAARRGFRKTREGLVVSDKMDKTVVVVVEDRVKHALYGKVIRRTSNLKAHDEALADLAPPARLGRFSRLAHAAPSSEETSSGDTERPSSRSRITV